MFKCYLSVTMTSLTTIIACSKMKKRATDTDKAAIDRFEDKLSDVIVRAGQLTA